MAFSKKTTMALLYFSALIIPVRAQWPLKGRAILQLHGKVKSYTETIYSTADTSDTWETAKLKQSAYGEPGKVRWVFNKAGDVIQNDWLSMQDSIRWQYFYTYSRNKTTCEVRLIQKLFAPPFIANRLDKKYFYNKKGKLDSMLSWDDTIRPSNKTICTYFGDSTVVVAFSDNGDSVLVPKKTSFIKHNDKKIAETREYNESGGLISITQIKYDDKGNQISSSHKSYAHDWEEINSTSIQFIYGAFDKKGNWTKSRKIFRNDGLGTPSVNLYKRVYIYY